VRHDVAVGIVKVHVTQEAQTLSDQVHLFSNYNAGIMFVTTYSGDADD
jgi:hypothetical protein